MAAPFGGHPRFGQYLRWAVEQGCKVQSGYSTDGNGGAHTVTTITAPSGRYVIEVGTDQLDFIVPTTIARLDRRLGLKSPFFSIDG